MHSNIYFDNGFYIAATNSEIEELLRELVDKSYISKHIYDVLVRRAYYVESGIIHEITTSLTDDPRDDFFESDEIWETLYMTNIDELEQEIYMLPEDEIILYYFNKKHISKKQSEILESYFYIMSCYPDTEYSLSMIMDEASEHHADMIVENINDFSKKHLCHRINQNIKDKLNFEELKPAYDCYDF